MKILLKITLFLFLTTTIAYSQVGINTDSPDNSAELDVTSENNDKGVLIPRLTTTERNGITNPASSLLIFNETETKPLWTESP